MSADRTKFLSIGDSENEQSYQNTPQYKSYRVIKENLTQTKEYNYIIMQLTRISKEGW